MKGAFECRCLEGMICRQSKKASLPSACPPTPKHSTPWTAGPALVQGACMAYESRADGRLGGRAGGRREDHLPRISYLNTPLPSPQSFQTHTRTGSQARPAPAQQRCAGCSASPSWGWPPKAPRRRSKTGPRGLPLTNGQVMPQRQARCKLPRGR